MTTDTFVFNPYAPSYDADPTPVYRHLLAHAPVYWWERGRAFLVSKHADVVAMMKDPRFSRSARDGQFYVPIPDLPEYSLYRRISESSMQAVSPSDHLRLRRLMNPAFSPKAAERLREDTRQIAMQALAALPEDEVVDLAAFADYIPLRVVGRLFAIPAASEDAFLTFAQARIGLLNPLLPPSERDRLIRIVSEGFGLIAALIAERRAHPGDDLLSTLIHHEEAGARLSEYELMSMVGAIIVGGSDTTVHTLRFMLLNLLRNPEQLARVRADTRLVGALLEETLRFDQFGKLGSPCYALEDLSIRGVPIARGQMVIPMAGAATHDPEAFERPEVFDIGRTDLGVALNFGVGPHVCLGVHLARMEANVVVPLVLEHFPEMTLAGPPEYQPSGFFRVMHRLPVRVRRAVA